MRQSWVIEVLSHLLFHFGSEIARDTSEVFPKVRKSSLTEIRTSQG